MISTDTLYQGPAPQLGKSLWVLYDLRHPEGRDLVRKARAAWGEHRTDIYPCGADHIILGFRPGGAREVVR